MRDVFANIKESLDKRKQYITSKLLNGLTLSKEETINVPVNKYFVVLSIAGVKYQEKKIKQIFKNNIENIILYVCISKDEKINVLMFFINKYSKEIILEFITSISGNDKYIFGISKTYRGINYMPGALVEAENALEYYSFYKKNIIYYKLVESLEYIDENQYLDVQKIWNIVKIMLEKEEYEKISLEVFTYFENKKNFDLSNIKNTCIELMLYVLNYLMELNNSYGYLNITLLIKSLLFSTNIDEIKKIFAKYIRVLEKYMKKVEDVTLDSIKIAVNYMENNYMKHITLDDVAEVCYLHPAYFSKVFKEETKKNFIDYLTELRINKAKILLNDNSLKVSDVAVMTGFASPKYFAKKFKLNTSLTPSEYRRNN